MPDGQTNKVYIWLAVDMERNKVVDFEVSIPGFCILSSNGYAITN
ncbi:hypothetical protein [Candidatus Lariskella endosymbiont of Hedychridium roseum]